MDAFANTQVFKTLKCSMLHGPGRPLVDHDSTRSRWMRREEGAGRKTEWQSCILVDSEALVDDLKEG
jgi:hypothetical protein